MKRHLWREHLPALKLAQTWLSEEERWWRSRGGGGGGGGVVRDVCGAWYVAGGFGLGWFGAGGDGWVNERADDGGVGNRPADCASDVAAA